MPKNQKGLPSWVPDFSIGSRSSNVDLMITSENSRHAYWSDTKGNNILEVQGHILGPIHTLLRENLLYTHKTRRLPTDYSDSLQHRLLDPPDQAYLQQYSYALQQVSANSTDYRTLANLLALGLIIAAPEFNLDWCSQIVIEQVSRCLNWKDDAPANSLGNVTFVLASAITASYLPDSMTLTDLLRDIGGSDAWPTHSHNEAPKEDIKRYKANSDLTPLHETEQMKLEGFARHRAFVHVVKNVRYAMENQFAFVCRGHIVGVAQNSIRDSDVLARFDMDPAVLYVLRPLQDDLFQLVSRAWAPQLMTEEFQKEGEVRKFRLC